MGSNMKEVLDSLTNTVRLCQGYEKVKSIQYKKGGIHDRNKTNIS